MFVPHVLICFWQRKPITVISFSIPDHLPIAISSPLSPGFQNPKVLFFSMPTVKLKDSCYFNFTEHFFLSLCFKFSLVNLLARWLWGLLSLLGFNKQPQHSVLLSTTAVFLLMCDLRTQKQPKFLKSISQTFVSCYCYITNAKREGEGTCNSKISHEVRRAGICSSVFAFARKSDIFCVVFGINGNGEQRGRSGMLRCMEYLRTFICS